MNIFVYSKEIISNENSHVSIMCYNLNNKYRSFFPNIYILNFKEYFRISVSNEMILNEARADRMDSRIMRYRENDLFWAKQQRRLKCFGSNRKYSWH
jgi:hypothetical protein